MEKLNITKTKKVIHTGIGPMCYKSTRALSSPLDSLTMTNLSKYIDVYKSNPFAYIKLPPNTHFLS